MAPKRISIQDLPVELLDEIFELAPLTALKHLTRVSRLLNRVAVRHLYAVIALQSKKQLKSLAASLRLLPGRGQFVKQLLVQFSIDKEKKALGNLSDILERLFFLERLYLLAERMPSDQVLKLMLCLKTQHLTHLTLYNKSQSFTDVIAYIMNHHPGLKDLILSPTTTATDGNMVIALPKLETFVGPGIYFCRPTIKMPLKDVSIAWQGSEEPKTAIQILGLSSKDTLQTLACWKLGPCEALLEYVAKYLPNLRHLEISHSTVESQESVRRMAASLAELRNLYSFEFNPEEIRGVPGGIDLRSLVSQAKSLKRFSCRGIAWVQNDQGRWVVFTTRKGIL